jgi:hypothetical protein
VRKSRYRHGDQDGYQVLDIYKGVIDGLRCGLTVEEVIERYGGDAESAAA